jgi:hypothetical protein
MKTHSIKIVVELYYDIADMPDYATNEGVAKLVELAFDNHGMPVASSHFDKVLGIHPVEILINNIEPAK